MGPVALHWQADSYARTTNKVPSTCILKEVSYIKNLKFQLCHENFPMSYECSVLLVMSSNK